MPWKILIVDDHFIVREGIKIILKDEENLLIVDELDRGDLVIPRLAKEHINLVLLDIELPGLNGITVAKEIKKKYPTVKILILSFHDQAAFVRELIQLNVDGYILKDASRSEMLEAIYSVLNGQQYFSKQPQDNLLNSLRRQGTDFEVKLSDREIEVMVQIASGLTIRETAHKLNISEHTVETHRKRLMAKLSLKNKASLAVYAKENGYLDIKD